MRRLALLAAVLMIAGLAPATALAEEHVHSDNMTFLGNLEYAAATPDGTANYGTDIEFADLEVPRVRPNGQVRGTETRQFALAGTYDNGLQIVDISDPEQVSLASVYDCGVLQGDVQVFTQDGRTYATYTSEDSSSIRTESRCVQELVPGADEDVTKAYGTYIIDVTDPYAPVGAAFISVPEGSHNGSVHPSGDFFYNSNAALIVDSALPAIEIYDIADLATRSTPPQRVGELPLPTRPGLGTESHDITFNAAGDRAYSAALSHRPSSSTPPTRPGRRSSPASSTRPSTSSTRPTP